MITLTLRGILYYPLPDSHSRGCSWYTRVAEETSLGERKVCVGQFRLTYVTINILIAHTLYRLLSW